MTTLEEARAQLKRGIYTKNGVNCPCCGQRAKVYRRPMTATAARALVALYANHGTAYHHLPSLVKAELPDVAHQGGYATLSHYWDLISEERTERPDGGRAGWWRVTPRGEDWLRGNITVPKYALIYDSVLLGFDGEGVSVADVLKTPFDLRDLIGVAA